MEYLAHHGVKGQKWGVRRYQNPDGSLTQEGKERYHKQIDREARKTKAAIAGFGAYGGGIVGAAALTYKDINFNRDEQHMYVESGKYFMSRTLDVKLKK